MYRLMRTDSGTPRDMKHFVNCLAAYCEEWDYQLEIPIVAAYLLRQELFLKDLVTGMNSLSDDPSLNRLLDEKKWKDKILELHFHVDANSAKHVLIRASVKEALTFGESKHVKELANLPGFNGVLKDCIIDVLDQLSNSATALAQCARLIEELDTGHQPEYEILWNTLAKILFAHQNWYALNRRSGEGLIEIIKRQKFFDHSIFITAVLNSLSSPVSEPDVSLFYAGCASILEFVMSEHLGHLIPSDFGIPHTKALFNGFLFSVAIGVIKPDAARLIKVSSDRVYEEFSQADLSASTVNYLKTAVQLWEEVDWDSIAGDIVSRMASPRLVDSSTELAEGLRIILWLTINKIVGKAHLDMLVNNGYEFAWLKIHSDVRLRALCILVVMLADPDGACFWQMKFEQFCQSNFEQASSSVHQSLSSERTDDFFFRRTLSLNL